MEDIIFSIIMPTYNSERTLGKALRAIRNQTFPQRKIEILVVDGGSTDSTIKIAKKYGAIIIPNPKRLPEPAKLYGMQKARGKYMCVMGSDEIMKQPRLLEKRYRFLKRHPDIHGMLAELKTPANYHPCCAYLNAVGDPFTCFVYKTYGDRKYNLRKHLMAKEDHAYIYKFDKDDIIPIGDGGTVMDLSYIKTKYPELMQTHETSVLWDIMIRDHGLVACMENDWVEHLSLCDLKTYLKKLKFRVINNIHDIGGSGYAFRARTCQALNKRKYLYPFYCISLVLPLFDGIRMTIRMRSMIFLAHPFLCWYVLVQIVYEYVKKLLNIRSVNSIYGR